MNHIKIKQNKSGFVLKIGDKQTDLSDLELRAFSHTIKQMVDLNGSRNTSTGFVSDGLKNVKVEAHKTGQFTFHLNGEKRILAKRKSIHFGMLVSDMAKGELKEIEVTRIQVNTK